MTEGAQARPWPSAAPDTEYHGPARPRPGRLIPTVVAWMVWISLAATAGALGRAGPFSAQRPAARGPGATASRLGRGRPSGPPTGERLPRIRTSACAASTCRRTRPAFARSTGRGAVMGGKGGQLLFELPGTAVGAAGATSTVGHQQLHVLFAIVASILIDGHDPTPETADRKTYFDHPTPPHPSGQASPSAGQRNRMSTALLPAADVGPRARAGATHRRPARSLTVAAGRAPQ
jgi:hypothetical protein